MFDKLKKRPGDYAHGSKESVLTACGITEKQLQQFRRLRKRILKNKVMHYEHDGIRITNSPGVEAFEKAIQASPVLLRCLCLDYVKDQTAQLRGVQHKLSAFAASILTSTTGDPK